MAWTGNHRLLALLAVGVLPFSFSGLMTDVRPMLWGFAVYSAVLWALFFRHLFEAPQVTNRDCITAFLGTAFIGIAATEWLQQVPPWSWIYTYIAGERTLVERLFGFICGVGVIEEVSKALVLFFLARRLETPTPHTLLVLGLMSGLGFGIHEGVDYQSFSNVQRSLTEIGAVVSQGSGSFGEFQRVFARNFASNMLRLTSLPFAHAVWTGMAGYFIGMAAIHPGRRHGLYVVAIAVPAVLHGVYDVFAFGLPGLVIMSVSVIALMLYLVRSEELDRELSERSGKFRTDEVRAARGA